MLIRDRHRSSTELGTSSEREAQREDAQAEITADTE